jgi:hypothetical protein
VPDLRPREARFVEEYLVDRNGKHAAIRTGYAASGAAHVACQLLKSPAVREALQKADAERAALAVSKERVLGELASIAFGAEAKSASYGERLRALALISRLIGLWRNGADAQVAAAPRQQGMPFERIIIDPAKN